MPIDLTRLGGWVLLPVMLCVTYAEAVEISSSYAWRTTDSPVILNEAVVVLPSGRLVVEPGVTVQAHSNASIIVHGALEAQGTDTAPITFTRAAGATCWGGMAFLGKRVFDTLTATGILAHCVVEYADHPVVPSHTLSAAVSAEFTTLRIRDCIFTNLGGTAVRACDSVIDLRHSHVSDCGEGVNVVRCDAHIVSNRFSRIKHGADAIDVDLEWSGLGWKPAVVDANVLANVSGDGIDLGGSAATVSRNLILHCADKGISIGEGSNARIENNVVLRCRLGIAVKDSSAPSLAHNTVVGCEIGVSCYEKELGLGGARGCLINSVVWGCGRSIALDELSILEVQYSYVQGDGLWPGAGNRTNDPGFTATAADNVLPVSGSPLLGAGTPKRAAAVDFYGRSRASSPSVGAFEHASTDRDADRDGTLDADDAFPFYPDWSSDSDADSLADGWEQRFFAGLAPMAHEDPDKDGADNHEEFQYGAHPRNAERMVVINEIMYNPDGDGTEEFIELYNRGEAAVHLGSWQITDEVSYTFAPGTVLTPEDYLVISRDPAAFHARYGPVALHGAWHGLLAGANGVIRLVSPNHTVVDLVEYRGHSPWPVPPDGGGPSLELRAPSSDNNAPANWAASALDGGTPGRLNSVVNAGNASNNPPATPAVVINELMYHPLSDEDDEEYIELYNAGTTDVNLTGWQFTDGISYVFPAGTILNKGSHLVIANDPAVVGAKYGIDGVLGPFASGRLSNRGEQLELRDDAGNVVDAVYYHDRGRWPRAADGDGPSLELLDPQLDNALGESWQVNRETTAEGTPGTTNSVATEATGRIVTVAHFPTTPAPSETVTVRARVYNGTNAVRLLWKRDTDGSFTVVEMKQEALTGLYRATIPPQAHRALVEYYVAAYDGQDHAIAYPFGAPTLRLPESGRHVPYTLRYLCLNDASTPRTPRFRVLMCDETRTELLTRDVNSDELLPVTFVYMDEVFASARIRYRGMTKRLWPVKSYRLDLRYEHPFADKMRLNLNGRRPGPEWLATEYFKQQGFAVPIIRNVRLHINHMDQGPYLLAERIGADYVERNFPGADSGAWYESFGETGMGAGTTYPPEIDDCLSIVAATNHSDYAGYVTNAIDPDQWLRWLATTVALGDYQTLLNGIAGNHACYLHPDDKRLMLLPLDLDACFDPASTNMHIHLLSNAPPADWRPDMRALDAFMRIPRFKRRYYQMIVDQYDSRFTTNRLAGHVADYFAVVGSTLQSSEVDMMAYLATQPLVIEGQISNAVATTAGFVPRVTSMTDGVQHWWPYTNGWICGQALPDTDEVLINGTASGVTLDQATGLWRFEAVLQPGDTDLVLSARPLMNRSYETASQVVTVHYDGGDTDGDGLPNSWECFWGLDPTDDGSGHVAHGRSGDVDADGIPNWVEHQERTDPTRSNQYTGLALTTIASHGTAMSGTWSSLSGAVYRVQRTESLLGSAWIDVGQSITANSQLVTIDLDKDGNTTQRFYRILLEEWPP